MGSFLETASERGRYPRFKACGTRSRPGRSERKPDRSRHGAARAWVGEAKRRSGSGVAFPVRTRPPTYLGASQDNLARDEDEEYDFGLDHTVDQAGEQLRVGQGQPARSPSEPNTELDEDAPLARTS